MIGLGGPKPPVLNLGWEVKDTYRGSWVRFMHACHVTTLWGGDLRKRNGHSRIMFKTASSQIPNTENLCQRQKDKVSSVWLCLGVGRLQQKEANLWPHLTNCLIPEGNLFDLCERLAFPAIPE